MVKKTAQLFFSHNFGDGGWAPDLKRDIGMLQGLVPGWRPKSRIWRGTFVQWVQFEPEGSSGPLFWRGKPAIRASRSKDSRSGLVTVEEALFVGYYVERGLPTHPSIPEAVMDPGWEWYGFKRCLSEPDFRKELDALMMNLPAGRRTFWIDCSESERADGHVLPPVSWIVRYAGASTLADAALIINGIAPTQWVNVMLGSRFTKDECLERQHDVVTDFRNPIVRANEIRGLIENAKP